MDKNKKINWLNIILNTEFRNAVQIKTLLEVSMASKLIREKLKPVIFKKILISFNNIQFESNPLSMATDQLVKVLSNQSTIATDEFDYYVLKEKHSCDIREAFNEYEVALKNVKKFARCIYFQHVGNTGYYLYPIIYGFENLTKLGISSCNIPFTAFIDIGKALPNLNNLSLFHVNLVKSPTDVITPNAILFPLNLSSLTISYIKVDTTDLLLNPYEYLFKKNVNNHSYERFILPKYSLPFLKRLEYCPSDTSFNNDTIQDLEEFLDVNPKLESLRVSSYNLKMSNNLNSLKSLSIDDKMCFNSIGNISSFDSINSLSFSMRTSDYTQNFRKLCTLCNNLTGLSLCILGASSDSQDLIDEFLMKALPSLFKLKTIQIDGISNSDNPKTLDFSKFTQIEELVLFGFGSPLNIKFDKCKNLKRIKFSFFGDVINNESMENFNNYNGWTFNYQNITLTGNKI